MKIVFFGTQPYDRDSFDRISGEYALQIEYTESHLNIGTVSLASGADAVCIFVNDTADAETIGALSRQGIKLIALRCAGYNNVDLRAAAEYGIKVVRVPAYSPHAVAEHAVALMLALNRKIHRAYWRTRDGNFSLHGLMGFDMYGKTAGIIGTGKIARELIRILKGFGMEVLAYDLYPDEAYAYTEAGSQYQYMWGENLLVAPVYQNTQADEMGNDVRDGIYLPGGDDQIWIDYFTGQQYRGGQILNGYDAPLWKIPLFVKNGPSTCGLGLGGEGYLSYSIATATGEGISNPKTFTRRRRCVMVDNLNIF